MKSNKMFNDLLKLSFPTMMAMVLQSVYDIVDMAWVGRISFEALAGVTLFSTIMAIFLFLNEIIGASSISLISQNYGRGDYERTNRVAEQTITFKVFVALIAAFLLYFLLEPILKLYSKDPKIIEAGLDYGRLRIYFLPMFFASYSINTIFRCAGDSKTPFYIMLLTTVVNLILDPILMFDQIPYMPFKGFGLGVKGAALATVISIFISFAVGLVIIFKGKGIIKLSLKGLFRLDYEIDEALIRIGFANGVQVLFRFLFAAVIIKFVSYYGDYAISAFGVGSKIYGFAFFPISGLSMGGSVIAGQKLGEDNIESAEECARVTGFFGAFIMLVFCVYIMFNAQTLVGLFSGEKEVLELGAGMITYSTIMLPLLAYGFGLAVVFYGSGYNLPIFIAGLVSQWFIQLPLLFLTVSVLHLPIKFMYSTYMLADLGHFLTMLFYYKRGKWKYSRVS